MGGFLVVRLRDEQEARTVKGDEITMKKCWKLRGCPASFYMNCIAFTRQLSCWEIGEGCYCHANPELECNDCPLYKLHLQPEEALSRGKGTTVLP